MKTGITHRLFLALLAASALTVVCMVFIMQWNLDRGFLRFVNSMEQSRLSRLAERLETLYAEHGNWDFVADDPRELRRLIFETLPDDDRAPGEERRGGLRGERHGMGGDDRKPPGGPPPHLRRAFAQRVFLMDGEKRLLLGPSDLPKEPDLRPLRSGERVVGYLGLLPHQRLSEERQLRFLRQQKLAFVLIAVVVLALAAGLALLLAKRLVRPIRALAAATGRLTAGEFATRVSVKGEDELGHLARDFNLLAQTLEKNEQARRQWVADISHELRTPIAVLRGEIEAIQDGIRQPTPETVHSLHGEVLRLGRLVDDLYQLSLSDLGALTYRKEPLDPAEVLEEAVALLRPEYSAKGIDVVLDRPEKAGTIFGDAGRLQQLFVNILDNGLKYTDPGGRLAIRLAYREGRAEIDFDDTPPGVPEADLERLFDRLYRVEGSRSRKAGGAGLGLAICRNIVEAHDGTITALPSPLGGVRISVALPLREDRG